MPPSYGCNIVGLGRWGHDASPKAGSSLPRQQMSRWTNRVADDGVEEDVRSYLKREHGTDRASICWARPCCHYPSFTLLRYQQHEGPHVLRDAKFASVCVAYRANSGVLQQVAPTVIAVHEKVHGAVNGLGGQDPTLRFRPYRCSRFEWLPRNGECLSARSVCSHFWPLDFSAYLRRCW